MRKKTSGIPAYEGPTSRRIRKLVVGNPKRGAASIRFAQYRTGMTVADYIVACEKLEVPITLFSISHGTAIRVEGLLSSTIECQRLSMRENDPTLASLGWGTRPEASPLRPFLATQRGLHSPYLWQN
jgi:hypothetical protein